MKKLKNLHDILAKLGFEKEAKLVLAYAETDESSLNKALEALSSVFNGSTFSTSVIPQKISQIPSDLTSFVASKGRSDVSFSSNGVLRDLKETLRGGAARDPGSYHGLGLAHDLKIMTPKNNNSYSGIEENKNIIEKDPELVDIMREYAEKRGLKWGGDFRRGSKFTLPSGKEAYDMELHHFEIPTDEISNYINPAIMSALNYLKIDTELLESSSGRQKIYKDFISLFENKQSFVQSQVEDSELSRERDLYQAEKDYFDDGAMKVFEAIFS